MHQHKHAPTRGTYKEQVHTPDGLLVIVRRDNIVCVGHHQQGLVGVEQQVRGGRGGFQHCGGGERELSLRQVFIFEFVAERLIVCRRLKRYILHLQLLDVASRYDGDVYKDGRRAGERG